MNSINALIERVRAILTSAVTVLSTLAAVVVFVIANVDLPIVAEYGATALSILGGLVLIIRRVTPVADKSERGLV